jgi:hypothetical protein
MEVTCTKNVYVCMCDVAYHGTEADKIAIV